GKKREQNNSECVINGVTGHFPPEDLEAILAFCQADNVENGNRKCGCLNSSARRSGRSTYPHQEHHDQQSRKRLAGRIRNTKTRGTRTVSVKKCRDPFSPFCRMLGQYVIVFQHKRNHGRKYHQSKGGPDHKSCVKTDHPGAIGELLSKQHAPKKIDHPSFDERVNIKYNTKSKSTYGKQYRYHHERTIIVAKQRMVQPFGSCGKTCIAKR